VFFCGYLYYGNDRRYFMRVLIQEPDTKRFYRNNGTWTDRKDEATVFNNSVEAMEKCLKDKLHAEVILSFRDPAFNLKLPCINK